MNIFEIYLGDRISRTWCGSDMGFLSWNKHMFEGTICSNGVLIFSGRITDHHKLSGL